MKTFFTPFLPLVTLLTVTLFVTPAFSQPGSNDATFNSTDKGYGSGQGANNEINSTHILSTGKIIIAGDFTTYNGTPINRIARLNTDGSLDATFNPGSGANASIRSISIQSDGKIIIAGSFTIYNGTTRNYIARLNSDGSLDVGFNPGSGANTSIGSTTLQTDGKIIIGGGFTTYNGTTKSYLARLNTDGSLDAPFNSGVGFGARPYPYNTGVGPIAIQTDGKIIVGGGFASYNGTARNNIARLNPDGTLDPTFNPGSGITSESGTAPSAPSVHTLAIQNDGKIIITGAFSEYNGTERNYIARVNTDGSLDAGFNPGKGANSYIYSSAIQSDGKIIIGGDFTIYNQAVKNNIARLNTDGSLDAGFNNGTGPSGGFTFVQTTPIQSDGKIIVTGFFSKYNGTPRNQIVRVNNDGSLDTDFSPRTGASSQVNTASIQSDGKIIIGGTFTIYNDTGRNGIARLNLDGSLDARFNPGTGVNDQIRMTTIQSDGKIIIVGDFTTYNGTSRNRVARLNADGSLDAGFNPGAGANGPVLASAIQPNGKIIIGGAFTSYNGTARSGIARLNPDGSIDAAFNPGTGANNTIVSTALQSDGKIIIGGNFTSYNGTTRNRIARLNTDGSLDAGFDPAAGASATVFTSAIQSDGKIIIAGSFTSYNGMGRSGIARLNTDGSLDATFDPGTGVNASIYTTTIQSDGKIIIGGDLTVYNGTQRSRIALLNTDGSVDPAFDPGTGANATVFTTAIQSNGNIIIAGSFTSYNSTGRNRVARVIGKASALPLDGITIRAFQKSGGIQVEWMPATETDIDHYEVEKSADGVVFNKTNSVISLGNTMQSRTYTWLDATLFPGTNYYRVRSIAKSGVTRYTTIVRLSQNKAVPSISIYPLPITGNTFNLQLRNLEKGAYTITIINKMGQQLYRAQLQHTGGSATETIDVKNYLAAGSYQLQVTNASVNISMNIIKN